MSSKGLSHVFLTAFAWAVIAFLALPLAVIIGASFTDAAFLSFPPRGFTLKWYLLFLADESYLRSMGLSATLALSATALALALGVPAALVLTRVELPGRGAISALFLSPLILPIIVIGIAILQYASYLGFARTFLALLVGHAVIVIPYIVRTCLASLAGMDLALEEAAQDLGATPTQTFFLVTLPQIKPGIVAGAIFSVIISWINVEVSIFNTTAALLPIPVKLFNYIQFSIDPMIAAVSAFTIYVAIAIVLLLDRTIGIDKINAAEGVR